MHLSVLSLVLHHPGIRFLEYLICHKFLELSRFTFFKQLRAICWGFFFFFNQSETLLWWRLWFTSQWVHCMSYTSCIFGFRPGQWSPQMKSSRSFLSRSIVNYRKELQFFAWRHIVQCALALLPVFTCMYRSFCSLICLAKVSNLGYNITSYQHILARY